MWPPIGKIAAHSAYDMFSWYKYLIVSLVFSLLGFWSGDLFLIAPFPDHCLLVPFYPTKSPYITGYADKSTAEHYDTRRRMVEIHDLISYYGSRMDLAIIYL